MAFRDAFPIFHTTDLERAVTFYRELLGFEERFRLEGEFVLVGLGPFEVGFARSAKIDPAGRVALWLYCDDVDAEIAALREAGVEVAREPADMEWGADGRGPRSGRERDLPRAETLRAPGPASAPVLDFPRRKPPARRLRPGRRG